MNLLGKKVSFLVSLSESKVEEAEQGKTGGACVYLLDLLRINGIQCDL